MHMINWFLNTFSTSSEQAKLFSIIVSAILAVCLLLTNQWFISRKAKKELLIAKIEELLTTVYAYERLSLDILSSLFNGNQQSILDKIVESTEIADRIEMLCVLYFRKIKFDSNNTQEIILKVQRQFDGIGVTSFPPKNDFTSCKESIESLAEVLTPLKKETKKLMRVHT